MVVLVQEHHKKQYNLNQKHNEQENILNHDAEYILPIITKAISSIYSIKLNDAEGLTSFQFYPVKIF